MKNLYVVESPFQLLNAIEAIHTFPANQVDLYIRHSDSSKNDEQLKNLIKKIDLPKEVSVHSFLISSDIKKPLVILKMLVYFIKFRFIANRYEKIFIGCYESRFLRMALPFNSKTILLDDGLKTISTQNNFNPGQHFNWFTIFDLQPIGQQKIYKNEFKNLQSHIKQQDSKNKSVLFIGTKLSEENIITEDYNVEIIERIAKENHSSPLKYVAHRGESQTKLERIQEIQNVEIIQLSYPLELLPVYGDFAPSKIISFYSTALITLQKIYQVETIGYKFDYSQSIHKDNIKIAYDYCEHFFQIKELPI
jgi:hypothetical protein